MAVTAARRTGTGRLFGGARTGTAMVLAGLALAVMAGVLVLGLVRQARAAATAVRSVPQVYVVMATRDIAETDSIPADAVVIKPFPEGFAPEGALTTLDQVAGKFADTRLTRDQIVLASQVTATQRETNLSETIPSGKVAFWMPLPELLAQAGSLRAGDRVDILLSLEVPVAQSADQTTDQVTDASGGLTTQTTLQNVEVFSAGPDRVPAGAVAPGVQVGAAAGAVAPGTQGNAAGGAKMALFLFSPQDAVRAKFIKDSGGTIDFVLRSREWQDTAPTAAVNAQTVIDEFGFRTP